MGDYMPVRNYWDEDADDPPVIRTPNVAANREPQQYMPVAPYWQTEQAANEQEEPKPQQQPARPLEVDVSMCGRMKRVENSGVLEVPAHVMEARCSAEKAFAAAMLHESEPPVATHHEEPKFAPPGRPYWQDDDLV